MQAKFQRLGLVLVGAVVLAYICYRAWLAGGLENLMKEIRGISPTPTASASPGASPTQAPTRTAPAASGAPQATPTGAAGAVLFSINQRRAGSVILQANAILMREAQEHASDMVRRGYFDHTDPDGVTFEQRMAGSGYPASALAENLGLTSERNAAAVVGLWMDSPGHRENMLSPAYREVGIGVATGIWQGQQATFVVAIFGAER